MPLVHHVDEGEDKEQQNQDVRNLKPVEGGEAPGLEHYDQFKLDGEAGARQGLVDLFLAHPGSPFAQNLGPILVPAAVEEVEGYNQKLNDHEVQGLVADGEELEAPLLLVGCAEVDGWNDQEVDEVVDHCGGHDEESPGSLGVRFPHVGQLIHEGSEDQRQRYNHQGYKSGPKFLRWGDVLAVTFVGQDEPPPEQDVRDPQNHQKQEKSDNIHLGFLTTLFPDVLPHDVLHDRSGSDVHLRFRKMGLSGDLFPSTDRILAEDGVTVTHMVENYNGSRSGDVKRVLELVKVAHRFPQEDLLLVLLLEGEGVVLEGEVGVDLGVVPAFVAGGVLEKQDILDLNVRVKLQNGFFELFLLPLGVDVFEEEGVQAEVDDQCFVVAGNHQRHHVTDHQQEKSHRSEDEEDRQLTLILDTHQVGEVHVTDDPHSEGFDAVILLFNRKSKR